MAECIHGLDEERCDSCGRTAKGGSAPGGTMAGKSFALIFAPRIRDDTFLHLNREGDHWKIRWYPSPTRKAVELAQSGKSSTRIDIDLSDIRIEDEISYPYSTSPGGVTIQNSQYWFDEIAKANARRDVEDS